jgi:hypothetical protein
LGNEAGWRTSAIIVNRQFTSGNPLANFSADLHKDTSLCMSVSDGLANLMDRLITTATLNSYAVQL